MRGTAISKTPLVPGIMSGFARVPPCGTRPEEDGPTTHAPPRNVVPESVPSIESASIRAAPPARCCAARAMCKTNKSQRPTLCGMQVGGWSDTLDSERRPARVGRAGDTERHGEDTPKRREAVPPVNERGRRAFGEDRPVAFLAPAPCSPPVTRRLVRVRGRSEPGLARRCSPSSRTSRLRGLRPTAWRRRTASGRPGRTEHHR